MFIVLEMCAARFGIRQVDRRIPGTQRAPMVVAAASLHARLGRHCWQMFLHHLTSPAGHLAALTTSTDSLMMLISVSVPGQVC